MNGGAAQQAKGYGRSHMRETASRDISWPVQTGAAHRRKDVVKSIVRDGRRELVELSPHHFPGRSLRQV
jgi:hypothetical protein